MSTGIRTRIATMAAISTVALLSVVGTIGYLSLVEFTRRSQIDLLDNRLDEVEAQIEAGDAPRPSASFSLDTSVRLIEAGRSAPQPGPETLQVVRPSDQPDIEALVGTVSTRQIDATLATIRNGLWVSVLVTGLVVGLITWAVVDRSLAPVRRLTRQAEAIEADPSAALLPVAPADDELGELATTFNRMLSKLRTADDERRRFVSDASHELRTPLMVLAADAEYALARPGSPPPAELEELALSVQGQTDRLTTLVEDLLTLAAMDEGQDEGSDHRPLGELMKAASMAGVSMAGVSMPALAEAEKRVLVPDVSRALTNLLGNALRHRRSLVEVAVEAAIDEVTVVVDDDGPGVPEEEREHVFKRFYRADAGRARRDGGAGLGLAIARADVDRAGGRLDVVASPLGGARFRLSVPIVGPNRGSGLVEPPPV